MDTSDTGIGTSIATPTGRSVGYPTRARLSKKRSSPKTVQPKIHDLAGSFDPDEIDAHLEDDSNGDVTADGRARGFDLYRLGSFRFAVRDDYLVRTLGSVWNDPDAVLEYVLEARWARAEEGGTDGGRRWADDDRAGSLLAERGSGQFADGAVFPPREPVEEPAYDREWQTELVGTTRSLAVDGANERDRPFAGTDCPS
ncbi:hypothetical protein [Natrinema longum]|uniref:hypothetical protein n=1 Tax=Natrinema longum TaxID=370324 RepID=UPI001CCB2924|nr:hypothetical protein [Natrinema longum]